MATDKGSFSFQDLKDLDREARMRTGAARILGAHTATFEQVPLRGWIAVTYSMGPKTRVEHFPHKRWTDVCSALQGVPMRYDEFAAYYPAEFWLHRYLGINLGSLVKD